MIIRKENNNNNNKKLLKEFFLSIKEIKLNINYVLQLFITFNKFQFVKLRLISLAIRILFR